MNKLVQLFTIETNIANRNVGLDIMRSAGVLMVFFVHSLYLFTPHIPQLYKLSYVLKNGVEVFFGLSGFLIGNILIKLFVVNKDYSYRGIFNFYKRRWYRTLPLYFFGILLNLLVGYFITGNYKDFNWRFLVFIQNISEASFWFFPASYSLSIEEWFYFLFPIGFLTGTLVLKNSPRLNILLGCIVFIVMFTAIRWSKFDNQIPHWDVNMRKSIITRLDCSIYGILMSLFLYSYKDVFKQWKAILLFIGLFIQGLTIYMHITMPGSLGNFVFYFNLIPISFVLMIPWLYHLQINNQFTKRMFTWLGLISFSVYIIHLSPLLELLNLIKFTNGIQAFFYFMAYAVCVFTFSTLLYKYFEKPLTNLRDK
ncbi:MAG: acyltransferase [Bacteroidota bacterium]